MNVTDLGKRVALMLTSVVVTTLMAECGVRTVYRHMTSTGDNSSYWARRWTASHVRRNHLGFRERDFSDTAPAGRYRIAVVGDSFTFGQGIDEGDRYTNRVEAALNRPDSQFEVLNFGQPGAETVDEVGILEQAALGAHPDFVLLQWLTNDVEGDDKSGRPEPSPLLPFENIEPWLHEHSALYYLSSSGWEALQSRLGWVDTYEHYMQKRFADPKNEDSRAAGAALADFVARCRSANVPVGIVLFPSIESIGNAGYGLDFLHERVLDFCRSEGLPCVDLRAEMARAVRQTSLVVNRYDSHPNAEANRIAAEEVLTRFGGVWRADAAARIRRRGQPRQ